jgi:hypothetical protein
LQSHKSCSGWRAILRQSTLRSPLGAQLLSHAFHHAHLVGVVVVTRRTFEASNSIAERARSQGHVTIFRENFALNPGQEIAIELNSIQALK